MRKVRFGIWWLMDHICDWTGHTVFYCWNRPLWINRLWVWAYDYDL